MVHKRSIFYLFVFLFFCGNAQGQLIEISNIFKGEHEGDFAPKVKIFGNKAVIYTDGSIDQYDILHFYEYSNSEWLEKNIESGEKYIDFLFDKDGVFWRLESTPDKSESGRLSFTSNIFESEAAVNLNEFSGQEFLSSLVSFDSLLVFRIRLPLGVSSIVIFDKKNNYLVKGIYYTTGKDDHSYGSALGIDSRYLAVGSTRKNNNGKATGCVYIYDANNDYQLDTILFSHKINWNMYYGSSVLFFENYLIVSAKGAGSIPGEIYLYKIEDGVWSLVTNVKSPIGGKDNDMFGQSIAMKDSRLFVGCPRYKENGKYSGVVFEYEIKNDELLFQREIKGVDPKSYRSFGWDIDVDDKLIVSAKGDPTYPGVAYVFSFEEDEWIQEARIESTFMASLSGPLQVSDSILLVGSGPVYSYVKNNNYWEPEGAIYINNFYLFDSDKFALYEGSIVGKFEDNIVELRKEDSKWKAKVLDLGDNAYVECIQLDKDRVFFEKENSIIIKEKETGSNIWKLSGIIQKNQSPSTSTYFGHDFTLLDSLLFVQQMYDRTGADSLKTGAVYLFEKVDTGWGMTHTFFPPDGNQYNTFGYSISKFEDYVAISSPKDFPSGSVYIFHRLNGVWVQEDKIQNLSLGYATGFGRAVVFLDGETLAISAYRAPNPHSRGVVFIYRKENGVWKKVETIRPSTSSYTDHDYANFGDIMAKNSQELVITAPYLNQPFSEARGGVFVIDIQSLPVKNNFILPENDIRVYPNPTKNVLYVESPPKTRWWLINQFGQAVLHGIQTDSQLNLTNVKSGIFILLLEMPDGEVVRKKIVLTK